MTLFDGLVALGVIAVILFVILGKVAQNNPGFKDMLSNLFDFKKKEPEQPPTPEFSQQLWQERRTSI